MTLMAAGSSDSNMGGALFLSATPLSVACLLITPQTVTSKSKLTVLPKDASLTLILQDQMGVVSLGSSFSMLVVGSKSIKFGSAQGEVPTSKTVMVIGSESKSTAARLIVY
ncbi:hypothetical protein FGO68_gene7070 [Halteria grandinella]|uniref:Uncharacterized protein n=1 Tax=Halteria grandinella TaxID=5974 RepID=A0A8J8SUI3_HALGN|nr:hypothetical protein FGO68_gene7070 [Halteria grandinella]